MQKSLTKNNVLKMLYAYIPPYNSQVPNKIVVQKTKLADDLYKVIRVIGGVCSCRAFLEHFRNSGVGR